MMHGKGPRRPCKVPMALVFADGGVTAARMVFLVPKMVAFFPQSVARHAQGSVSKPTKIMSLALSPNLLANRMSPPDRAGITPTIVPGFMYGANFSKYSPCAQPC